MTSSASSRSRSWSARVAPWTALRTRCPISCSWASTCPSASSIPMRPQYSVTSAPRVARHRRMRAVTTPSPFGNARVAHAPERTAVCWPRIVGLLRGGTFDAEEPHARSHHSRSRRCRCPRRHRRWRRQRSAGKRHGDRRGQHVRRPARPGVGQPRRIAAPSHAQLQRGRLGRRHRRDREPDGRLRRVRRSSAVVRLRRVPRLSPDSVGSRRHRGRLPPRRCQQDPQAERSGAREASISAR